MKFATHINLTAKNTCIKQGGIRAMAKKLLISMLLSIHLTTTAFAFNPACVAGGCEQETQQNSPSIYDTDKYKCVCPYSGDAVETFLDAVSVLLIPLKIASGNYNFTSEGISIERLIKKGCTCKKKESQSDVETNATENAEKTEQKGE